MSIKEIIKKQDRKYTRKYKPITTGLPKGMNKYQWRIKRELNRG